MAFHWAGVMASTVLARPLVALVAVPIWLLRSAISGCSSAWFVGFTCAWAFVASEVRAGIAVMVIRSASAAIREAGSTST